MLNHRGSVLNQPMVIALTAFAVVAFLFLVDTAINPNGTIKSTNAPINQNSNTVACTEEAKICPDGTAVGRTGPDCAFAPCPGVTVNGNRGVVCAADVFTCPDGSFLARQPPSCTFTACPSATTVNTNTKPSDAPSQTYAVSTLTDRAEIFDDESVCVKGWYQSSPGSTVIGADVATDAAGQQTSTAPLIWVNQGVSDVEDLTCRGEAGKQTCTGYLTRFCAMFRYAAPGEAGFGADGAYRWQLTN